MSPLLLLPWVSGVTNASSWKPLDKATSHGDIVGSRQRLSHLKGRALHVAYLKAVETFWWVSLMIHSFNES